MGRFRVYLKTFDSLGNYESTETEISDDVLKLSDVKQSLDSTEYDIGVFKLSSMKLTLRNDRGKYLEPSNLRSIFSFKRKDSIIRVTWDIRNEPLCVGFFKAGSCGPLSAEIEVFKGLVDEVTATNDIDAQTAVFDVLGLESLFDRVTTPFSSISNGDNLSAVLEACLDQARITELLTVSGENINPGLDQAIDDKSDMENQTVKEALGNGSDLLFASQSVLTIESDVIKIQGREATAEVQYSFFGPASNLGNENIVDIKGYRAGFNSLRNFWTWEDTALVAQDTASVDKFGVQKKEIDTPLITDTTKRQNLLNDLRDEFANPKIELTVIAPMTTETVQLKLLDKIDIDYPTVYKPADDNPLPIWGQAVWGEFSWPIGSFELTISQSTKFKVIGRTIKVRNETIELKLREV